MTAAKWLRWLGEWLATHPVKRPSQVLQRGYVEEVMARIQAAPTPSPGWRFSFPRVSFALGTAAACALAVVLWVHGQPVRVANQVERDWDVLAEVGEFIELNGSDLEEEIRATDQLMLAQAVPSRDESAWLEQTIDLLDQVESDEDLSSEEETLNEEGWLDELEWLDDVELASS